MKIKKITSQTRRDFYAIYVCEGCGNEYSSSGYDDDYYHENVIPDMKCKACGKTRNEMGIQSEKTETKYPSWMQV